MGNTFADVKHFLFSHSPKLLLGVNHQPVITEHGRLPARKGAMSDEWRTCCYCSLSSLASPRRPVSHSFRHLPPPSLRSGVAVTDPSGTAYPSIPEQLYGSWASVVLRPGDERRGGKTYFSLFPTEFKAIIPTALCSFVAGTANTNGSQVCSFDTYRITNFAS